jgi:glycosyltransferase involved in cell wall biosynthesis
LRILLAASFGNPSPGGFIPLVAALGARLRSHGHEVAFIVPRVDGASWYPQMHEAGIDLFVVNGVVDGAQAAVRWRPDIAHMHFFGWEAGLTAALWPARTRIVWHAHSTSLRAGKVRRTFRNSVKYRVFGTRVARFVAVSNAIRTEIVSLGAPASRFVVIPNEVDTQRFRPPTSAERASARAALGIDGPTILFFGRDPAMKGTDVLCRALAEVPGAVVLTVATPEPSCAELARVAQVVRVGQTDDVVPLLWAADVLAMPSRGEGMSFAQREAQFTGLPLVASDLPALREGAVDGAPARFFPVDDHRELAQALKAMLHVHRENDRPLTRDGGPERWAERVEALYASIQR